LSLALGFAARERGRSFGWTFLSLLISPPVAGFALYVLPEKSGPQERIVEQSDLVLMQKMEIRGARLMTPLRVVYGFLSVSFGILLFGDMALAEANAAESSPETIDECLLVEGCIDQYLWSLYERTPKIGTISVTERKDVTVELKGKTRIVTKTITKFVD